MCDQLFNAEIAEIYNLAQINDAHSAIITLLLCGVALQICKVSNIYK